MNVSDVMTAQVATAQPNTTIEEVARTMAEVDSGAIPVVQDGKVVGLVTDRDIVIRVVAKGGAITDPVSAIMSEGVQTCTSDTNVADAAAQMGAHQVRRLVVVDDKGALSGILSLGDIALDYGAKVVGHTLEEISAEPADH